MRIIDSIVKELLPYLNNKKILEITSGDSDFSLKCRLFYCLAVK